MPWRAMRALLPLPDHGRLDLQERVGGVAQDAQPAGCEQPDLVGVEQRLHAGFDAHAALERRDEQEVVERLRVRLRRERFQPVQQLLAESSHRHHPVVGVAEIVGFVDAVLVHR